MAPGSEIMLLAFRFKCKQLRPILIIVVDGGGAMAAI